MRLFVMSLKISMILRNKSNISGKNTSHLFVNTDHNIVIGYGSFYDDIRV